MSNTDHDINELKQLVKSSAFRILIDVKSRFNIFSLFDKAIVENSYSRVFAYFLDSRETHGCADRFLRTWIKAARLPFKLPKKELSVFTTFNWKTADGRFLDILVEAYGRDSEQPLLVVGIENKVFAGEQPDQVKDYQSAIGKNFPDIAKSIVFLTPHGRQAATADHSNDRCPCYEIGYASIESTCRTLADDSSSGFILKELADHLQQRFVLGDVMKSKIQDAIRELKKDPGTAAALSLLAQYGEPASTIRNLIYEDVMRSVSIDIAPCSIAWHYPRHTARPREFNFVFGPWIDPAEEQQFGFRLIYMLVSSDQEPDVDSEFQVLLMAYRIDEPKTPRHQAATKRLEELKSSSPPSIGGERQWSRWFCLWAGGKHRLRNLGDTDTEALVGLLKEAFEATESVRMTASKLRKVAS